MAGNSLLTSSIIVKRALAVLSEEIQVLGMVNRQYDPQFKGVGGAKVGDTVSVRVPQRAVIRKGRIMDIAPINDKVVPVKIDQYYGVDTGATSAEMALQINDFERDYIRPKIKDLLVNVESDFINTVAPLVPGTVGDYGLLDDAKTLLQAKAYMDIQLAPMSDRNFLLNTLVQVDTVDSLKGLFNDQGKIGQQYRGGRMYKDTLGWDFYPSNLTASVTRGTGAGYLVNGGAQSGSTLVVDTGTGTLSIGDTFTIAGVFMVHPQTKKVITGQLMQFTVTASVSPGGAGSWSITPAITPTGSEQNVSNSPADNAAITIKGAASTVYAQNLGFSRDAFYFVSADLPNPPGSYGVDSASASYNGLTLRFQQGFDIVNDMWLSRFDILWGGGILRPELAVRVPSTYTNF